MPRPDGRVEAGQKIQSAFSARAWNRAQDAADLVLGAQGGAQADGVRGPAPPYTAVPCRNTTNTTIPRWGVLAISGVDVTPAGSAGAGNPQFESLPVLRGAAPVTGTVAWGVAVEPIPANAIGRLAVDGVVQAKLDIKAAGDAFAKAKAGSTAELETSTSGEGMVLWKESGTGVGRWGLVRIAGGGGAPTGVTGVTVLTSVALTESGLVFERKTVMVSSVTGATGTTISVNNCPTGT